MEVFLGTHWNVEIVLTRVVPRWGVCVGGSVNACLGILAIAVGMRLGPPITCQAWGLAGAARKDRSILVHTPPQKSGRNFNHGEGHFGPLRY